MNRIKRKIDSLAFRAYFKANEIKEKAFNALKNEDGDTNFLSIIIILAIVLVVAVVFIGLKNNIVLLVNNKWSEFNTAMG